MSMATWDVIKVPEHDAQLQDRLSEGWEPFAVSRGAESEWDEYSNTTKTYNEHT